MTKKVESDQKKLILVIDDDENVNRILKTALEGEGYDVMCALGVDEAIAYIEVRRPDLIICDIMMPEKDGHDFLKELRGRPAFSDIKVIMLTALSDFENIRKTVSAGVFDYLTKPIESSKLFGVIRNAFNEFYEW
ncbi:MAG TPA: response regulator [Candidatus Eremiobacteraeota bacterium]|nr:MAG: Transcriptional regulatory protein YycF [bacterium ADurb.Bin363]HPZ08203.1 response regulator [Candidatus Eremiobacteraeota bacterium]